MSKDEIIQAVRAEIAQQGITQYEVAKRADLRRSTVNYVYTPGWGQQLETLCKIAEAVGLEIVVKSK